MTPNPSHVFKIEIETLTHKLDRHTKVLISSHNVQIQQKIQKKKVQPRKQKLIQKYQNIYSEIKQNPTEVDFNFKELSTEQLELILLETRSNPDIQELYLGGNNMKKQGIFLLIRSLSINTWLKELDLGINPLGDKSIVPLCRSLIQNFTLERLFLNDTQIRKKGVREMGRLLTMNNTLKMIDLSENPLGDSNIELLAQSLFLNNSLERLNLMNTKMRKRGAKAILNCLKVNFSLKFMHLDNLFTNYNNHISVCDEENIQAKLTKNRERGES